jgi:hypothetical protein
LPWQEIAVDLVGPWTLQIGDQEHAFLALTMIDMVTNLVEVVRLGDKLLRMLLLYILRIHGYLDIRDQFMIYMIKEENSQVILFKISYNDKKLTDNRSHPKIRKQIQHVSECIKLLATHFECYLL